MRFESPSEILEFELDPTGAEKGLLTQFSLSKRNTREDSILNPGVPFLGENFSEITHIVCQKCLLACTVPTQGPTCYVVWVSRLRRC